MAGLLAAGRLAAALACLLAFAAAPPARAAPVPAGGWQLPLPGSPPILRSFDPPAHRWSPGHRGVDLAGAVGTDVLAAGPGVVAFAGPVAGRGVVTVRHGQLRTTYEPVRAVVAAGAHIRAGDVIGRIERGTHCGTAGCLHWGLLRGEQYLDPMTLLRPGPARLLPVWGVSPGAPAPTRPPPDVTAGFSPGAPDRAPAAAASTAPGTRAPPISVATAPGASARSLPNSSPGPFAADTARADHESSVGATAALGGGIAAGGLLSSTALVAARRRRRPRLQLRLRPRLRLPGTVRRG